jgi:hypothetical protein
MREKELHPFNIQFSAWTLGELEEVNKTEKPL